MILYVAVCHTLRQLFPICQESHFLYTSCRVLFFIRTLINTSIEPRVSVLSACRWPCRLCPGGQLLGTTQGVPGGRGGEQGLNRPLCPCRQPPPQEVTVSPAPFSGSQTSSALPRRCPGGGTAAAAGKVSGRERVPSTAGASRRGSPQPREVESART